MFKRTNRIQFTQHSLGLAPLIAAAVALPSSVLAQFVPVDNWVGSSTPPSTWTNPDSTNWFSSTSPTPTTYNNGDTVQFFSQYSYGPPPTTVTPNSFTVTFGASPLSPSSMTVRTDNTASHEYIFTGSGSIGNFSVINPTTLTLSAGTLNIMNPGGNTYTGTTRVTGTLLVNNTSNSATGTGPVIVDATGMLGGSGFIGSAMGGLVTVNSGGSIVPTAALQPNAANNLTLNNGLILNGGSSLGYNLNLPNTFGTGGGNDLTTVNGAVTINPNTTLSIKPGASFNAGTYELVHYGSLLNNSSGFQGWGANFQSAPSNLAAGQYLLLAFHNDAAHNDIELVVTTTSTAPTFNPGGGDGANASAVLNNRNGINNYANPVVNVNVPPGFAGAGASPVGFFMQQQQQQAAVKPISITAALIPFVFFNDPDDIADDPPDLIFLAPLISIVDPPSTSTATYYAEGYSDPLGLAGKSGTLFYLADFTDSAGNPCSPLLGISNCEDDSPTAWDTLPNGDLAQQNFVGSLLQLEQLTFPTLTAPDPALLPRYLGSFGRDPATQQVWAITNDANVNLAAWAETRVPEPSSLSLLGAAALALSCIARRRRTPDTPTTKLLA